jgi:hypothetical protein
VSSTYLDGASGGHFQLRRVFAAAGLAVRLRWLPMLVLSLILAYAPSAMFGLLSNSVTIKIDLPPAGPSPMKPEPTPTVVTHESPNDRYYALSSAMVLLSFVSGTVLGVALTSLTVAGEAQGRTAWKDALALSVRDTLPLVVLTLATGLATAVGYIFFIVPGAVMTVAWCLTFPVRVAERTGLIATLRRSAALTRGRRWQILGLLVIWAAVYLALNLAGPSIAHAIGASGMSADRVLNLLVNPMAATLSSMIIDVMLAALYIELRRLHDGVAAQSLDAVFA